MRKSRITRPLDVLFSPTRRGVLELTFGEPDREWFLSEMAKRLKKTPSSLQREVEALESAGLLRSRREGRRTYYQAEQSASIFPELRALIVKTRGIIPSLREAIQAMSRRIDVALVYGSTARGDDRATSDVDLLVISDEVTLEELYRAVAPLEERLGRTIQPTLYGRDEFRRKRESGNPFLTNVLGGETVTLVGDLDAVRSA